MLVALIRSTTDEHSVDHPENSPHLDPGVDSEIWLLISEPRFSTGHSKQSATAPRPGAESDSRSLNGPRYPTSTSELSAPAPRPGAERDRRSQRGPRSPTTILQLSATAPRPGAGSADQLLHGSRSPIKTLMRLSQPLWIRYID